MTDRLIDRFYFGGVRPRAAANKSFKPSFKADRCTDKADGHTDAPTHTHTQQLQSQEGQPLCHAQHMCKSQRTAHSGAHVVII